MEKQFIKELVEQLACVGINSESLSIKTGMDYSWQDFAIVSDADAVDLDTISVKANGTIYESGATQLTITILPAEPSENVKDAYKRLKAKNLVLVYIERAGDAKRAYDESTELLEKAAYMLGITPAQALEMINKSESKR
jgi:hypothetical protein